MIIIGYPGIGKTTLGGTEGYIDLESSKFKYIRTDKDWKMDYNYNDWVIPYINVALSLSSQGYKVFVSSHEKVIQLLATTYEADTIIIVPSIELKEEWTLKLHERYVISQLTKDYRAWQRALGHYEEDINSLLNETPFKVLEIESMDYDLQDILYNIDKRQET